MASSQRDADAHDPIEFYRERVFAKHGFWPDDDEEDSHLIVAFLDALEAIPESGYADSIGKLYRRNDLERAWHELPKPEILYRPHMPIPIFPAKSDGFADIFLTRYVDMINAAVADHGSDGGYCGDRKIKIYDNRIVINSPAGHLVLLYLQSTERGWRIEIEPITIDEITHGWLIPAELARTDSPLFVPGCRALHYSTEPEECATIKDFYNQLGGTPKSVSLCDKPLMVDRPCDSGGPFSYLDLLKGGSYNCGILLDNMDFILIDGEKDSKGKLQRVRGVIWFQFVNDVPEL